MRSESPLLWVMLVLVAGVLIMLNSPYLFSYVLVGLAILAGAAMVGVIAYVVYWLARNRLSSVQRSPSRVIRRRKKDWDVSLVGDTAESAAARLGMMGRDRETARKAYSRAMSQGDIPQVELLSGNNYFVTFDVGGQEQEFCVNEADYAECSEGAEGLLVFQGEQFKHFIPRVG